MNTPEQPLIRVEKLKKVYEAEEVETHALSDIALRIEQGEYVVLTGPSGCGKSTLLSVLGLLDSPTEGDYWLKGEHVSDIPLLRRAEIRNQEIGFIFQAFNLVAD